MGNLFFFFFLYQFPVKFYLIAFGLFLPLSDNRRLACCLHNMNYFTLLFYFRQSTQPFLNDARSISFHHYCMFSKRKAVTSADCKSHCDWFCNFHLPQISFSPIVSFSFPFHLHSLLFFFVSSSMQIWVVMPTETEDGKKCLLQMRLTCLNVFF